MNYHHDLIDTNDDNIKKKDNDYQYRIYLFAMKTCVGRVFVSICTDTNLLSYIKKAHK